MNGRVNGETANKKEHEKTMPIAGWVFRLEVITSDVAKPTKAIIKEIEQTLKNIPSVEQVKITELYEDITLFRKKGA